MVRRNAWCRLLKCCEHGSTNNHCLCAYKTARPVQNNPSSISDLPREMSRVTNSTLCVFSPPPPGNKRGKQNCLISTKQLLTTKPGKYYFAHVWLLVAEELRPEIHNCFSCPKRTPQGLLTAVLVLSESSSPWAQSQCQILFTTKIAPWSSR